MHLLLSSRDFSDTYRCHYSLIFHHASLDSKDSTLSTEAAFSIFSLEVAEYRENEEKRSFLLLLYVYAAFMQRQSSKEVACTLHRESERRGSQGMRAICLYVSVCCDMYKRRQRCRS